MIGPCLSCNRLDACKKATPTKIVLGEGCGLYEEEEDAVVVGRVRALTLLGPYSLTKSQKEIDMEAIVGSKRYHRTIATVLKAVPVGDSFKMKQEDLVAAIVPHIPNIAAMPDEELKAMISELKSGGAPSTAKKEAPPAEKKEEKAETKPAPKKRGRPSKKDTEAKSEEKVEAVAEKPQEAKPAPKKAPVKRGPKKAPISAKKPKSDTPDTTAAPSAEVNALINMIHDLSNTIEAQLKVVDAKAIATLAETVVNLQTKVDAIDSYFTWQYNEGLDAENRIESLSDVDWLAPF